MIPPTVGRVVWVRNRERALSKSQPEVALITYVHSVQLINVAGFNADGETFRITSLPLVQDSDLGPPAYVYAEWMPYQKGQAAKTEQLEQQAASR